MEYQLPPLPESNKELKLYKGLIGIALGITALAALDVAHPFKKYERSDTKVTLLESSYRPDNTTNTLFLGGFGCYSGETAATTLEPVFSNSSNVMVAEYSRKGLKPSELMHDFVKKCHDMSISDVIIYAHSMAGTVYLNSLPYLQELNIKKVILDSSPFGMQDVKDNQILAQAWALSHYPGGSFTQILGETAHTLMNKIPNKPIIEQIKESLTRATTGTSPRLKASQIGLLHFTNPNDYKKYLQPETEYAYLCATDSETDGTVDIDHAIPSWDEYIGGGLHVVRMADTGHANPVERPTEYLRASQDFLRPLGSLTMHKTP